MSDFQRGYGESVTFDGPTIPSRFPPDCPVPIKLTIPLAVAQENAGRAFWRGAILGALVISPISAFVFGLIWRALEWWLA